MSDSEKKPTPAEIEEAKKKLQKFSADSQAMLDDMESVNKFKMTGSCLDKSGNETEVLIIDTDRPGVLGMFMRLGQVATLETGGEMKIDDDKLFRYLCFMSNVDLENVENEVAIGWPAISKARDIVSNFFTLRLASNLGADIETGS